MCKGRLKEMSKKVKFLVTTGLKESWDGAENFWFLGEWCKHAQEESLLDGRDFSILEYHWNDSEKVRTDYKYLQELYERVLFAMAHALNDHHGVKRSVRYWRIILGPWLLTFLSVMWDRWENLRTFFIDADHVRTTIVDIGSQWLRPYDFQHFKKVIGTDEWNHFIFAKILQKEYSNLIQTSRVPYCGDYSNLCPTRKKKSILKLLIFRVDALFDKIKKKYRVAFVNSYLNKSSLIKLSLRLCQLPRLHGAFALPVDYVCDTVSHSELRLEMHPKGNFERFINEMIPEQLPMCYLENFEHIYKIASKIELDADVIFTANAHLSNDLFKIWAADKVESGSKLIISQHGGAIPFEDNMFLHQENISDKMIVWHKPVHKKHIRLSPNKLVGNRYPVRRGASELTFFGHEASLYSHRVGMSPRASGMIIEYNHKIAFVRKLQPKVRRSLRIRTSARGHGFFNSRDRYLRDLGAGNISSHSSLKKALKYSRFIVCTYPQTTFSEAMHSGIPVVLLVPEGLWRTHPHFDELLRILAAAKIYFNDPVLAAEHVNGVWSSPESWWNSESVCSARKTFHDMCGNVKSHWLTEWEHFFTRLDT